MILLLEENNSLLRYYTPGDDDFGDIAVLAFPVPQNQWMTNNSQRPKVTCNLPGVSAEDFFCKKSRLTTILPSNLASLFI